MTNLTAQKRMPAQTTQKIYLVCAVLSVVISWGLALQFLLLGDASFALFFQQVFANPAATLASSDVILSALILFVCIYIELRRLGQPANRLAIYVLATLSVGVCFALSLFLYQRESWLARA